MRIGAMLAIGAAICLTTWAVSADEKADLEAKIRALETKAAALLDAGQNEAALNVVIQAQKLRDRADALRSKPKQARMASPRDMSAAATAQKHLRQAKEALRKQQTMVALEHGRAALADLGRWEKQLRARENRLKLAQQQAEMKSSGAGGHRSAEAAENRLMERLERLEVQVQKLRKILKRQAARPPRKPTGPQ